MSRTVRFLGEKFQRTEVDRLERVGRAGLDVGDIGNAITHYHDGDRREDQVPLLRNSGDLAEEGIEIRERVGGRKPPSRTRFDLRDIPSGEFVDGTKRLGLAALLPPIA